MVRPAETPRSRIEGTPIQMDRRRAGYVIDPPRERNRPRSERFSRRRTEPIVEIIRDNAASRRMFHNMNIRHIPYNIEHNSMVLRSYAAHLNPPNLRETRNKPRNSRTTLAEHQQSRPEAQESFTRRRAELRRMLEDVTQEPQPGPSNEPEPGGSSGNPSAGSSSQTGGYWRPDFNVGSSSSDEETDTQENVCRNPRRRHQTRNIPQEVRAEMRAQAMVRRTSARMLRARNILESNEDTDNDDDNGRPSRPSISTQPSRSDLSFLPRSQPVRWLWYHPTRRPSPLAYTPPSSEQNGTSQSESSASTESLQQATSSNSSGSQSDSSSSSANQLHFSSSSSYQLDVSGSSSSELNFSSSGTSQASLNSRSTVGVAIQNNSSLSLVGSAQSSASSHSLPRSQSNEASIGPNSATWWRRESSVRICNESQSDLAGGSDRESVANTGQGGSTGTNSNPSAPQIGNDVRRHSGGMVLRPRVSTEENSTRSLQTTTGSSSRKRKMAGSTMLEMNTAKKIKVKWKRPPPHQENQDENIDEQRIPSQEMPSTSAAPVSVPVPVNVSSDSTSGQRGHDAVAYNTRRAVKRRRMENENEAEEEKGEGRGGKRRCY